ncbi:MAG TPA: carboxypeptidase regulatory-like domain-containing protein [Candidatus Saccharimonadales bacterium]|nr:carboxypeptidase regulatory-like domain-containing protein [Candidatus Saccharimonadales bacterium]
MAADGSPKPELDGDQQFDDAVTGRAIDDIVRHESDELLAAEDAKTEAQAFAAPHRGFWRGLGHVFGLWLGTSWGRWITFLVLLVAAGSCAWFSGSRYFCLNKLGVESTASVTVTDNLLNTPLQNVPVSLGGHTVRTNSKGSASFAHLKLGSTTLTITQPGFAAVRQPVTIGWGSNQLGTFALKSTGIKYTLLVQDYVTGQPIAAAEASIGEAAAASDKTGKLILTLADAAAASGPATIQKSGYRSEQVTLSAQGGTATVLLVPSQKDVFVSRTNGVYDLYKIDLDGKNQQLLLAGSGNETADTTALAMSPDGSRAAFVSVRDSAHAADGAAWQTLSLVAVSDGSIVTLAHAEQVRLIDWIGTKLIFAQTAPSSGTAGMSVVSYDYATSSRAQLAAANKLGRVFSAQGGIYYAPAVDPDNPSAQAGFYKINPDGSGKQQTFNTPAQAVLRTDYNTFAIQTADGWYSYTISSDANAPVATAPSAATTLTS